MEFYPAIKKNEIMLFASKWMELEIIMLSKANHAQKDKGHLFSHMWKLDLQNKSTYKYTSDIIYL
jgi:hypothetical protein